MNKTITYKDVSNYFIALSNETGNLISNLQLQKLMFYSQAWNIAICDKRFFDEEFQAWVHGPVLPKLYVEYKHFKWQPINENLNKKHIELLKNKLDVKQNEILEDVIEEYFGLTGFELEKIVHSESPWVIARNGIPNDQPSNEIIHDQDIREYYSQFVINS
jgi:uncharacterized phage-associated protein